MFKKLFSFLIKKVKKPTIHDGKKARLIMNPLAGEGRVKKSLKEIKKSLKTYLPDTQVDIFFSRRKGDMANCAKEAVSEGYDLVIVAGGDGAMNEVIQGMAGSNVPIGIIPLGSGNLFCEEAKIPKNINSAIEVIATGKIKKVDLGKVDNHYFLWMAGVGIDALIAKEVHGEAKDNYGVFAYLLFTIKHLKKIPYTKMKVVTDNGKEHTFKRVLVSLIGNASTYIGPHEKVFSSESIDDGYLDVAIAQRVSVLGVIVGTIRFMFGKRAYYHFAKHFDVVMFKAKKIVIESDPPVLVHTDGEVIGTSPKEFTVVPLALSLILPQ